MLQPEGRRKREERIEGRSVRRDNTVGELRATHLVRHLVSAQPVLMVFADAGLYNNSEVWKQGNKDITVAKVHETVK